MRGVVALGVLLRGLKVNLEISVQNCFHYFRCPSPIPKKTQNPFKNFIRDS